MVHDIMNADVDELARVELVELVGLLRDKLAASHLNNELGVDVLELQTQLAQAGDERATARNEAWQVREELRNLRQSVTEKLKELVSEDTIEMDTAKEVCESLGCPSPVGTFDVEITVRITVRGLEADDSDEAESLAEDAISVDFNGGGAEFDGWETDSVECEATEA